MATGRERHVVAGVLAGDVEGVRVGEDLRVPVGAGQQGGHQAARRQVDPRDGRAPGGEASGEQHRRVVAQHLVDGVAPQVGLLTQRSPLLGVRVQQGDPVAQQVDGGLEAGREDQPGGREELGLGQAAVLVLHRDQLRQQVVAGVEAQVVEVVDQPAAEVVERGLDPPHLPQRQPEVEARRGGRAEVQDALTVLLGHAEHLGDDRDGQRRAVRRHQVDRFPVPGPTLEVVEELGGDLLRALAQLLDRTDGEDAGDQLAVAGVLGRLDDEQRRGVERADPLRLLGPPRDPAQQATVGHEHPGLEVRAAQHLLDRRQ